MRSDKKWGCVTVGSCSNGWIVQTGDIREGTYGNRYAFETWESLVDWLSENLEDNSVELPK